MRKSQFAGMVMTWFQACLILSGGRYPVGDVRQIVGNVELKLSKFRSGNQVYGDVKAVEVKISQKEYQWEKEA